MRGSVTVHMAASADLIWDLVSDVTRVGEFSPETFEAEWLGGASSPETGARFRGHVRRNGRGPVYWTVCTVAACDPGREFAFTVAGPGGKTVNTWRYQLEPAADGTDVTESFELPSAWVSTPPVTGRASSDRKLNPFGDSGKLPAAAWRGRLQVTCAYYGMWRDTSESRG